MSNTHTAADIDYLLSPRAIRERTAEVFALAEAGKTHFSLHLDRLPATCDFVMEVIQDNYPTLDIPFHSRWGHFKVGGMDRLADFKAKIADQDALAQARAKLDLVVTSVLLDAGAGTQWRYQEGEHFFNRSEGLAVASYHMFLSGAFSSDAEKPLQADATGLQNLSEADLEAAFQVSESNPLVGVAGRTRLLNALGQAVANNPTYFPHGRVGSLVDYLIATHGESFEVQDVLRAVLDALGSIWPGRVQIDGVNLGDVWPYAPEDSDVDTLVPFHKLSQWLTYSMVEPMWDAGLSVTGAEKLTGLAEYRNGGLFLDMGVIALRNPALAQHKHVPSSALIIEWRALTLQLLDRIGAMVQERLGKSPAEFPLAKVLEGGTWWAGRRIAQQLREDGSTPLHLDSDGTVF